MSAKQMQLVKILTVCGVIIITMIVFALVYNIVTLVINANELNSLNAYADTLTELIEENADLIEYRSSDEYIERYAREYLGMGWQYEVVYK